MSYMSEKIYSKEELREAVKEDRDRIREEIRQAIENGVIKIETGSEKLFEILECGKFLWEVNGISWKI